MTDPAINETSEVVEVLATASANHIDAETTPDPRPKVLHVLAVSVPHINGYTIRSKYIVETQCRTGAAEPVVVTSPFYPGNEASVGDRVINGTPHYRIAHPLDVRDRLPMRDRLCAIMYRIRKGSRTRWRRFKLNVKRSLRWPRRTLRRGRDLFVRELHRAAKVFPIRMRRPIRRIFLQFRWQLRRTRRVGTGAPGRLVRTLKALGSTIAWPFVVIGRGWAEVRRGLRVPPRYLAHVLEGMEEAILLKRFEDGIVRIASTVRPDVIHAHSPYRCGIPAAKAAARLGLPMVYEVRGFWEDSGVVHGHFATDSAKYRFWRRKENEALQAADAVVCICEQIKREIIPRGVAPGHIFIAPNAVDPGEFDTGGARSPDGEPNPPAVRAAAARLRGCVLGYVGSLRALEGVEELVRGVAALVERGEDVSLLVVGGGTNLDELREMTRQLGIGDRAVFTDRVPHELVKYYYQLIDVFVITRPDRRVTRVVTPLKPLEAMALGRALVMSDLPALREMGEGDKSVLFYPPGDVVALADVCAKLVRDPLRRQTMGMNARKWVMSQRTWEASLAALPTAYDCALKNAGARR